ncbi:hypothetical protein [Mesorhizobium sp.]|uniref:hypothetical protein n=1 Tax=Mesorhizobium sp. TaxID=1871066 RepID=UPI000FE692D5|nr:hypothetical protein [Mesorhizobium sp.]RWD71660.1 MAG: hypothetical protein EOS37_11180 [Mesorhizobium sp.]
MTIYVVEELDGEAVRQRAKIDAASAIQAASVATGRSIASGRNPDVALWVRVTDTTNDHTHEFRYSD